MISKIPTKFVTSKCLPELGMDKSDFAFGPMLGEGGLGFVFKATQAKTGETVAIKAMKKRQVTELKQVAHVKNEKELLETLEHPFIVNYKGFF